MIIVTSGAVMRSDDWKQPEGIVEGSGSPSPPRRTGSASGSPSIMEHGGRPVSAGIRNVCIAFSSGCNGSSTSGIVLIRYDQRPDKPCICCMLREVVIRQSEPGS